MSDITARLRGKVISSLTYRGNVLRITATDNTEMDIVWLDDNGVPLNGTPAVRAHGVRLHAAGLRDLTHLPSLLTKGHA